MNDLIRNKRTIIICFLIMLIAVIVFFLTSNKEYFNGKATQYEEYVIEKYDANQYIPVYVTESDMANKYLNDYKNKLLHNIAEAYELLNEEYKNSKYDSLDKFNDYVDTYKSISFYSMTVKEYSVVYKNGYRFYYINSSSNNQFIFKELSIMNYEVYLDDYTVEVK